MDEHLPHSFVELIISYLDSKVNKFLSSDLLFNPAIFSDF